MSAARWEVQLVAGTRAVLLRRLSSGELVAEATFESPSMARTVAAALNKANVT